MKIILPLLLASTVSYSTLHCSKPATAPIAPLFSLNTSLNMLSRPHLQWLSPHFKILDNTINPNAPSLAQLANIKEIDLIQPIVAWQDLTVNTFLRLKEETIKNRSYIDLIEFEHDLTRAFFSPETIVSLVTFFRDLKVNKPLLGLLKENKMERSLGGGFASCGYHAVLHLKTLSDASLEGDQTKRNEILERLVDLSYINGQFGHAAVNKMIFKKKENQIDGIFRVQEKIPHLFCEHQPNVDDITEQDLVIADKMGEWLSQQGILCLWDHVFLIQKTQRSMPVILTSHSHSGAPDVGYQDNRCFCLIHAEGNHWFGLLMIKKTKEPHLCIIVDSKNKPRYNDKSVIGLVVQLAKDNDRPALKNKLEKLGTPK